MSASMKDGVCPKCQSREVFVDMAKSRMGRGSRDELNVTGLISVTLTNYVCADCGYTESYVLDTSARERIRSKWERVGDVEKRRTATIQQLRRLEDSDSQS